MHFSNANLFCSSCNFNTCMLPLNYNWSFYLFAATLCSLLSGCLLMVTHWSTHLIKMATVMSWQNQTRMLQTQRSSSWTVGQANPYLVICTEPVCMRECCWPYMTEVWVSRTFCFLRMNNTAHKA